jgi:hypothetical protein
MRLVALRTPQVERLVTAEMYEHLAVACRHCYETKYAKREHALFIDADHDLYWSHMTCFQNRFAYVLHNQRARRALGEGGLYFVDPKYGSDDLTDLTEVEQNLVVDFLKHTGGNGGMILYCLDMSPHPLDEEHRLLQYNDLFSSSEDSGPEEGEASAEEDTD